MSHGLESGTLEYLDKKKGGGENENISKKIEEVGSYLESLEKINIYYPFNHGTILSLYGLKNTKEGMALIDRKKPVLNQIMVAIDREKQMKYWDPTESNEEIVSVLEELIGNHQERGEESTRH